MVVIKPFGVLIAIALITGILFLITPTIEIDAFSLSGFGNWCGLTTHP